MPNLAFHALAATATRIRISLAVHSHSVINDMRRSQFDQWSVHGGMLMKMLLIVVGAVGLLVANTANAAAQTTCRAAEAL
jgi:hypothetical protein